jgi:hypothetical protein
VLMRGDTLPPRAPAPPVTAPIPPSVLPPLKPSVPPPLLGGPEPSPA